MQLPRLSRRGDGERYRAAAGAQIDEDGSAVDQRHGAPHQRLGAAPRHEHPRTNHNPPTTKLRPAEHVLQRFSGDPAFGQGGELRRRGGRRGEQPGLVLGKNTSSGAQPADELAHR
jgi:hypothetical protein